MIDLLIVNGLVVDGTGAPVRRADVAVDGDRIVAVGDAAAGPARRTIDADGLVVTPGWVDIHTHYDGQATWDGDLAPSSINGVTSIVMGNCGVGFAPARPDRHEWLIRLLEGVEDIPGTALAEGMQWGWESFPEYLDVLERMHWTMDVGTQVPHAALRTYVMGEEGADHHARASEEQIAAMSRHAEAGIRAGALGFSTSRTIAHRTSLGEQIGTLTAAAEEVIGIAAAVRRAGTGVVQLISDWWQSDEPELVARESHLFEQLARTTGRPVSFTLMQADPIPTHYRDILAAVAHWNEQGLHVRSQVAVRPVGVLIGMPGSMSPLSYSPTYRGLRQHTLVERVAFMRQPEVRARILAEHTDDARAQASTMHTGYDRMYPLAEPLDYEPTPERSVAGVAAATGRRAEDVLYDLLLEDDGMRLLYVPALNYADGNLDAVREMMVSPYSIFGLSDAGAHCNAISDGSFPTTAISLWARDRTRGEGLPLEFVVHHQTQRTAAHVGWLDRGVIAEGYLADLNLIDLDAIRAHAPRLVADLPAGGTRLMQTATGYEATIKRGVTIAEGGELTGALPGRLQRGPQPL